ncbi:hypothetical protein VIGAN_08161400, partial [Vigna angularis var. angularis]
PCRPPRELSRFSLSCNHEYETTNHIQITTIGNLVPKLSSCIPFFSESARTRETFIQTSMDTIQPAKNHHKTPN